MSLTCSENAPSPLKSELESGARTLLVAPGLTTRNKRTLLVIKGIATSNKCIARASLQSGGFMIWVWPIETYRDTLGPSDIVQRPVSHD